MTGAGTATSEGTPPELATVSFARDEPGSNVRSPVNKGSQSTLAVGFISQIVTASRPLATILAKVLAVKRSPMLPTLAKQTPCFPHKLDDHQAKVFERNQSRRFCLSLPGLCWYCCGLMRKTIKIAQIGLGPIGLECIKLAATKPWARIVGAVDRDPSKTGCNVGALTGVPQLGRLKVVESVEALREKPDLVFQTTVSTFQAAYSQLKQLAEAGINVISSCEELIFPQLRNPELAARLDRSARRAGARVLGTGVNPGFVMDLSPAVVSGVIREIHEIRVERVVDASTRREPLQRKIGSGMAPARFRRLLRAGQAGHAGLRESLALLAQALGYPLTDFKETGKPVIARQDIQTDYLKVRRGETCGLHQHIEAHLTENLFVSLDLKMYLGASEPRDRLLIRGDPPVDILVRGGVAGDAATVAALVNSVGRLLRTPAGLRLATDLPATANAARFNFSARCVPKAKP
jgi:2,4-diaminopentanoate dehydrogenase